MGSITDKAPVIINTSEKSRSVLEFSLQIVNTKITEQKLNCKALQLYVVLGINHHNYKASRRSSDNRRKCLRRKRKQRLQNISCSLTLVKTKTISDEVFQTQLQVL